MQMKRCQAVAAAAAAELCDMCTRVSVSWLHVLTVSTPCARRGYDLTCCRTNYIISGRLSSNSRFSIMSDISFAGSTLKPGKLSYRLRLPIIQQSYRWGFLHYRTGYERSQRRNIPFSVFTRFRNDFILLLYAMVVIREFAYRFKW